MRWLAEHRIGVGVGPARVPIVPAAVIFDLGVGSPDAFPGPEQGYAACEDAARGAGAPSGAVGAGTGATVGKLFGGFAPGGLGSASLTLPGGVTVGALAVVNSVGDVVDRQGSVLAGDADSWSRILREGPAPRPVAGGNTTLAVVATDAALNKTACGRLATVAQDALAMAIRPVHTPFDGDTVFAASTGARECDPLTLSVAAVEALRTAIERAVNR
jgi:L-aminopeptidase/D-esterase-like protein